MPGGHNILQPFVFKFKGKRVLFYAQNKKEAIKMAKAWGKRSTTR